MLEVKLHDASCAYRVEKEIFLAARDLPAARRGDFLAQACGDQSELRMAVEKLLACPESEFMQQPADRTSAPESDIPHGSFCEEAGEVVGPYTLIEELGEGAFGRVWRADQRAPVRREVALKILKLGMDTREVIARFEQERQALALMDHPHIAKVFDAGSTRAGRPFFAMELVTGVRITRFCDEHQLPVHRRLELFILVCGAVQHAHQKGIIHRDLKPSNILVSLIDGLPVPKVIDFGVAKAMHAQRLTERTLFTHAEQMIGTPAYMAPEQAELSGADIDTRSDIYSLGVILFELLGGRPPFDPQKLLRAGPEEMRRIIREMEPTKLSVFVGALSIEERAVVAGQRASDGVRLIRALRGDLDCIVMKALEKERNQRYDSVSSLGRDVQRHLACEPVQARPPSAAYRFRRYARRHRGAFLAASAVVAALLLGLCAAAWMYFQERRARQDAVTAEETARREGRRSEVAFEFLASMLQGIDPEQARGRDTTVLREMLERASKAADQELSDDAVLEARLRSTIGGIYDAIGDSPRAAAMCRRSVALLRQEHEMGRRSLEFANALYGLGGAVSGTEESVACYREALAIHRQVAANDRATEARMMTALARELLSRDGDVAEAEKLLRAALEWQTQGRDASVDSPDAAYSLIGLSLVEMSYGRNPEAEALLQQAAQVFRRHSHPDSPDLAYALNELGSSLIERRKPREADRVLQQALSIGRKVLVDHPILARTLKLLGHAAEREGDFLEAQAFHREALAIRRKRLGDGDELVSESLEDIAVVLARMGRWEEAERAFAESLALGKPANEAPPDDLVHQFAHTLLNVLDCARESEVLHRKWLAAVRPSGDGKMLATALVCMARVLELQGRNAEAEPFAREALTVARKHPHAGMISQALNKLATNRFVAGRYEEAEPHYREVLARLQAHKRPNPLWINQARTALGRCLAAWAWSSHDSKTAPEAEIISRAAEAEALLAQAWHELSGLPHGAEAHRARARLGAAVFVSAAINSKLSDSARSAKLREAEEHLLSGYNRLSTCTCPELEERRHASTWLMKLYNHAGNPAAVQQWSDELARVEEEFAADQLISRE